MSQYGFGDKAVKFVALKKQAAIEIMTRTKQYFGDAFEQEGLGGEKWAEVARRTPDNPFNEKQVVHGKNKPSGKRFTVDQGDDFQTRKILRGTTGELKRKTVRANSSITQDGTVSVMINPLPYAQAINEGDPYMPARPFMKQTDELTDIQLTILNTTTGKLWHQI